MRKLAFLLSLLIGILAVFGGWHLICDPSGGSLGIPSSLLEPTHFHSYLVPGIVLIFFIGLFGLLTASLTIFRYNRYPLFIIMQAYILIVWLTAELLLNINFFAPFLHFSCYGISIVLLWAGYDLRAREREKEGLKSKE